MSKTSNRRILVVDDQPRIREVMAEVLSEAGYEVNTAEHGLDALSLLRKFTPEVIISDLNMPLMSGFELLSVVRRRFPDILVIAMSGAYQSGDHVPGGVVADAFFPKGRLQMDELLLALANLIQAKSAGAIDHQRQSAPVWIPRNGKDSNGVPFIVLTCTDCLQSFHLSVLQEEVQEIQETRCIFCETPVRFIIDFSLAVSSHKTNSEFSSSRLLPVSGATSYQWVRQPKEEHKA